MKKILVLLSLCLLCLGASVITAYAGDLDYIDEYHVTVTPNAEDGSLHIQTDFVWTVLDEGPVEWLQIGIPNGSVREVTPLSDNIAALDNDNSYMYVYFNQGYRDGETFTFSYSWVQEYMYTLVDSGMVSYDYTPGWFDEAEIGVMTLTWNGVEGANGTPYPYYLGSSGELKTEPLENGGIRYSAENLPHGAQLQLVKQYASWPTTLYWENSAENLDQYDPYWKDDYYWEDDYYYEDDSSDAIGTIFVIIFIIIVIIKLISAFQGDGYAGGFGTRYVLYHGLWYPMGRDGRPRPGSVGTKHKPSPPPRSSGGGFGGGSRGGGFGGGGFGGGGHCACASSCACACACACAGGGRAGCSAKNLYGAVKLDEEVSKSLENAE